MYDLYDSSHHLNQAEDNNKMSSALGNGGCMHLHDALYEASNYASNNRLGSGVDVSFNILNSKRNYTKVNTSIFFFSK